MLRPFVLGVFIAGCGHGETPAFLDAGADAGPNAACRIESVIAAQIGDSSPMDCGRLAFDATDAARLAARQCTLDANAAHTPFVVEWDIQGIDSRVAGAYIGIDNRGSWVVSRLHYDGDPGGQGGERDPHTGTGHCTGITDQGNCGIDLPHTLCLECAGETFAASCP
jgi:hypothetical protein